MEYSDKNKYRSTKCKSTTQVFSKKGKGKMKITLLLRYFNIGGLERVVSSLANSYVERGIDTQIIILYSGRNNALITELDRRVELHILEGNKIQKMKKLRKLTKDRIVHIHFGNGKIFPLVKLALIERDCVITYHSDYSHKRNWFLNRIDHILLHDMKAVIAVSDAVKRFCVEDVHIKEKDIEIIENAINLPLMERKNVYNSNVVRLISLANLFPHKNQITILKALEICKQRGNKIILYMMGDGPEMAKLYQYYLEHDLDGMVIWYGNVWHRRFVEQLLDEVDGFISASKFEGFPLSILEGMAYRLPLILSNIAAHRGVAGDAALYFETNDYTKLADIFSDFCTKKEVRERMGLKSANLYMQHDMNNFVTSYLDIYRRIQED